MLVETGHISAVGWDTHVGRHSGRLPYAARSLLRLMRNGQPGNDDQTRSTLIIVGNGANPKPDSLTSEITEWLTMTRQLVDAWINEDIASMEIQPGSVEEAMSYALQAGGKRIRPQLMLAAADYVGLAWDSIRPAVLAIEYLHTYSLIHDDLPAMDNDELRRGKPTTHKIFGEAMAILAGDALLTEAFGKMALLAEQGFAPHLVVAAIDRLAGAAGRTGLVRGQVQDLAAENKAIDLDWLENIQLLKTGAMFTAALAIPSILAEDHENIDALTAFGQHFGLVFQMVDDVLNVVGDSKLLGKSTGTDASRGKATYPRLMSLEEVNKLIAAHVQAAKRELDGSRNNILAGLVDFARDRSW